MGSNCVILSIIISILSGTSHLVKYKLNLRDFSGGPALKDSRLPIQGPRLNSWSGELDPRTTAEDPAHCS